MKLPLKDIQTPVYVADADRVRHNLSVAKHIKDETGCKILLALKACSQFSLFPMMHDVLDGTTASGIFEARLGAEEFGKEVHAYSPAYDDAEIEALVPICSHIYFNSVEQMQRYSPTFRNHHGGKAVIGLRFNPQLSQVKNSEMYDPSRPGSRFGVLADQLTDDVLSQIDLLHVHNLCENLHSDSVALIYHLMQHFPDQLKQITHLNLGGGHYITHPDYDVAALIEAINTLKTTFDLQVILEPGGALAFDAGYLVSTVLDIIENEQSIAILDTSATCHMPDVLEVPYRPNVIGDAPANMHAYTLTGKTCLTGDVIGEYRFSEPLKPGDKIIFTDMLQYSMVKNTTFNGLPLPDIGILDGDEYQLVKCFDYSDFKNRLS